jgi:TRAP-type mannitol/chloroaromatic compound transport system substrate-binding protein
MKGLKMRIGGFPGTIMSKVGLVPQQLAGGDIYPALEKGTIDACEWIGPYDDEKLGFNKVARYYYYPGWWEGCGQAHNIFNLTKWNELPKSYQSVLLAASHETWGWVLGKYDAGNPPALRRLVAGGAQLRAFPQDVMEGCYKAANDIYAEISRTNAAFKKLLDSVTSFRNDSYGWMQVAELGFDSFQIRMRART